MSSPAGRAPRRWPWLDALLAAVMLSLGAWAVYLRAWDEPALRMIFGVAFLWCLCIAAMQTRGAGITLLILAAVNGAVGVVFLGTVVVLSIVIIGMADSYASAQARIMAMIATGGLVIVHAAALASIVADARRAPRETSA